MMPIARRPVAERLRRWLIARCAPISIDGQTVEAVTIDGQDVTEVTMDGDTVFENAAIPDSENLESQYVASSFNLNDGDNINSAWADEQGNFDASVVDNPVYRSNAINGEPAVEFSADAHFDTGFNQDTNNNRSIYLVIKSDTTATNTFAYGAQDTAGNRTTVGASVSDSSYKYFSGYGDTFNSGGSGTTNFELYEVNANSGTAEMFVNAASQFTYSYTGQGTHAYSDFIGARNQDGSRDNPYDGQIAEILRYTVAHDATTRSEVRSFLNDKYSLY